MSDDKKAYGRDGEAPKPAEVKGSKEGARHSTAGKSGVSKPASKDKLAALEESGAPRSRSAKAEKASEVQAAGTAKAGGLHAGESVTEGGLAPAPTRAKGAPKPAASKAEDEGKPTDGTSNATAGRDEMSEAARVASAKNASGRGRRKADDEAPE